MPTEVIKYVDPDGGILADYTSLKSALAAEYAIRPDLVANDEKLIFICENSAGSADTSDFAEVNFTTDETRNVVIVGSNLSGILNLDKYYMRFDGRDLLTINSPFTIVKNIQFYSQMGGGDDHLTVNADNVTIINCIFDLLNTNGSGTAIKVNSSNNSKIINSIVYNFGSSLLFAVGISLNSPGNTLYIYNSIISGNGAGKSGIQNFGGTIYAYNVIVQNTTDGFQGTFLGDYNISDLAGDAPGANSLNNTTVNFADAPNGDLRLLAGSPGIDQGVNLSADPSYPFNTDIIGTVRPQGAAWDIGAFELIQQTFNPAWAKHSNQIIRAL